MIGGSVRSSLFPETNQTVRRKRASSTDVAVSDTIEERSRTSIDHKTLYTGKTYTRGGRDGSSRSSDGRLEIMLSPPGSDRAGTNPEQLFAAGWSACFIGAMGLAAGRRKIKLPADTAVYAEVDLANADEAYFLQARLKVSLPSLEQELAQAIVQEAHQTCPYSKATRGNINVELTIRRI
ncbi:Ohr family peroxiredoxin [Bradyrhizobium sp. SEMIA]|nr:Ohr family peroxiredoxin [Bradyrhizobium sp. SEMIA]